MRVYTKMLMVRGVVLLTWAVWVCAAASPGWAAPRFGRAGTYAVDGSPVGVRAGVFDAQAGTDLLTANEAGAEGPSLSLLFNRGQGSFFPEERKSVNAAKYILQAVASGDFDADGLDDVAVAVDDIAAFPIRASVLIYLHGARGLATPVEYRLPGFFPRAIEAADVTGDGVLDLVVGFAQSGGAGDGLVTTLAGLQEGGAGTGAFTVLETLEVGAAPSAITLGDVDGDERADALIADRDGSRVYILYGTGGAAAPLAAPIELATATAPLTALIDAVPGRALPQVLIGTVNGGRLFTLVQTAPRRFAAPTEQRIGLLPSAMALADADGDGRDDLFVVSVLGAELWTGAADGTFAFGESIVGGDDTLDGLALADLNGDGALDLAASASTQDRVTVVLNGVDAPFTPSPTPRVTATPTATPLGAACPGDCNGDRQVAINELIQGVNIALGSAAVTTCTAFDRDGNGQVSVNELIAGVNSAQSGCPLGAAAR